MKNRKYENIIPFILSDIVCIILWVAIISFTISTKFKIISLNIALLIVSAYETQYLLNLYNVFCDIRKNDIVTDKVFISFIKETKFDGFGFKRYTYLRCNKVKGKRYTGEILELKSKNDFDLVEGAFANITYYKKSKILNLISYNSEGF